MPAQPTILVVDDQPELLSGLQLTLEFAGFHVLTASDGHLALQILRSTTIDLILADIAMPQLNGYQLYEQVRADPSLVRIPFVFLSARAMESDIRYGKMLGVDDYLTKPVKPEDLLATIEGRLRRARDLIAAPPLEGRVSGAPAEPHAPAGPASADEVDFREADLVVAGRLRISPGQHRVWLAERRVVLPAREFRVLEYLARRAGDVVAPRAIVQISHGLHIDDVEAGVLLRPLIRQLRRRLGYQVGEMGCIENIRGVGYRLTPPA